MLLALFIRSPRKVSLPPQFLLEERPVIRLPLPPHDSRLILHKPCGFNHFGRAYLDARWPSQMGANDFLEP